MSSPRLRLLLLVGSLPLLVLAIAAIYMQGMSHLEDAPRDFWTSVEWAAETLTTTGYGSGWHHPAMVMFVIAVQFLGVFLIYLTVPVYLIPFLEQRLQKPLPRAAPRRIRDHVLIFRHGAAVETLLTELERHGAPYLVIASRTGAIVIGHWGGGRLETTPTSETRLCAGNILVALGTPQSLDELRDLAGGHGAESGAPFLIAGHGEVGTEVAQLLREAGEEVRVVDRRGGKGVDLEGDILDESVLEAADICGAQGVVLALDNDSVTLFVSVVLREMVPEVPIIARVNRADNVELVRRAGVDFALSISQVSGQMLAHPLLGEESLLIDPQLRILKSPATTLSGRRIDQTQLREDTGCSIVAVCRGGELEVAVEPAFVLEPDDEIFVCGDGETIQYFRPHYGAVQA